MNSFAKNGKTLGNSISHVGTHRKMIVDCIADLHGEFPTLEGGDLLIVAGDLVGRSALVAYQYFDKWLREQKYRKKIVIAGNHDLYLVDNPYPINSPGVSFLCDSGTEFEGLKIWGTPWTKTFKGINPNCTAFCLKDEQELSEKWNLIPKDTDILVTHCPPWGVLDRIRYPDYNVGSESLLFKSTQIEPILHVFGHIHEHGGKKEELHARFYVNASHVNENYDPVNAPVRVII